MVFRVYVEKKPGFDVEAQQLAGELKTILGISGLKAVRIVNRYDVEGISEELFRQATPTVFSEPQVDDVSADLPDFGAAKVFATEFLPGQFDQRADSASECIQLISQGERPTVRSAKVYALEGELTDADVEAIKHYVINPVEAREASLAAKDTLKTQVPTPGKVEVIAGFNEMDAAAGQKFIDERGLAMDLADLEFCQKYFAEEGREPTITEIKVIDTYWSDHCRHTTFGTELDEVNIDDAVVKAAFERYLEMRHELGRDAKPVCLMDMGTIGAKWLKKNGILTGLDESEEINACTVKVKVDVNGHDEDWLFLFKNETHNHPTEIEPFGGAATCIGGCIRDPLSGRSYVYQAMRVTGAADPTVPVSQTLEGKLPQRKLVTTAAAGYSSYGNQIGLATGQVDEIYHPGYVAKRMEVGAVVAATPADHVRRETPAPGDKIILLGGRTGRDGIGGATGASKAHNVESLELDGAEVQKGNAPVERKLQRLFRRGDACRLIKRCNDFGAGGVSVAVGELADGLYVDLNTVPKKYEGLDGTELAISESQERMAVDVAAEDVDEFLGYAREENLEATVIATVTEDPRMVMTWNGDEIVNLSREFLASNGASKHQTVHVEAQQAYEVPAAWRSGSLAERMHALVTDLNVASNKGLSERFDSTIGAGTVLMPFGGVKQLTPNEAMVAKFPVFGETTTASAMAWGFNPYIMEKNQFTGAYLSVVESLAKLVAAGFEHEKAYLSFQEYFEKLRDEPERWGKPTAAVLGALMAQVDLGAGAIGGKDSMSGSFEDLDVPPTLISFAVAVGNMKRATSPEFKGAGHRIVRIAPRYLADGITPDKDALLEAFSLVEELTDFHTALAVSTPGYGGTAEALFKMTVGNGIGVDLNDGIALDDLFAPAYGSFIVELKDNEKIPAVSNLVEVGEIGVTTEAYGFRAAGETIDLAELQNAWEGGIESVFPYRSKGDEQGKTVETIDFHTEAAGVKKTVYVGAPVAKPRVIIPVFPGNNCEYDSAAAFERAGAEVSTLIVNNLTPAAVAESTQQLVEEIAKSQIVMIPGGFSGGDEPDGSAKFITAFFRAPAVTEAVRDLLKNRDGLMLGICNGFQALIKLGLVPFGDIVPMTAECPTLTFNTIGRHQSRLVRTRVASDLSPWLSKTSVGDVHTVAISHGEGRFVASDEVLASLKAHGQIATQYVDEAGVPGLDLAVNPNGSLLAIEGITSPDGRVFGKMGHSERSGEGLYANVPGNKYQPIFEAGVEYFAA
ncbi:phosphoribosylformylglycinamidine synthase [Bifidobacterium miconisargentati]|uniref:phosphoribosylformylglycinamidine synthase n=1 Tax=Bifidobacterium miconisargentati TaxID=2834437 RepID=UPI001BDC56BE|nr:phosphoribosylformylglycinamidine synthase [Bifidobacterium miconisargentati]MBW3091261.1 phosphoribosylformylglycinamidine synthase [Bifidobacterium miconisargentati]